MITARNFVVERAELAGLQIARDAAMDVHDGLVTGCLAGANVQVPGYDFSRISERVRYIDNVTTLDTSELPVPDVETPL